MSPGDKLMSPITVAPRWLPDEIALIQPYDKRVTAEEFQGGAQGRSRCGIQIVRQRFKLSRVRPNPFIQQGPNLTFTPNGPTFLAAHREDAGCELDHIQERRSL